MPTPRPASTYNQLSTDQLRDELVVVSSALISYHRELGALVSEQHRMFLDAYARSPGSSVAAKNREAQYNTTEQSRAIVETRAVINSLTEARNLISLLLNINHIDRNLFLVDHQDSDGLYG